MVAGSAGIGIAYEFIELGGVGVVIALHIVAPTIGANFGAVADGVLGEGGIAGERAGGRGGVIEDAFDKEVRAGSDAQAVVLAGVGVGLAGGGVAGDDAGAVGAMAVAIGAIGEVAVILEAGHAAAQVRMHSVCNAGVEAGVGHADRDVGAVVAPLLGEGGGGEGTVVAADNFRGGFIIEFALGGGFQPEHGAGFGEGGGLLGGEFTAQEGALAQVAFVFDGAEQGADGGDFVARGGGGKEDIDGEGAVGIGGIAEGGGEARMDFMFGAVGADPGNEIFCSNRRGGNVLEPGNEGVVGDVFDEFDTGGAEFGALERFERSSELDEV